MCEPQQINFMMSLKLISTRIYEKVRNEKVSWAQFCNSQTDEERFAVTYDNCHKYISNLNFEMSTKSCEKSGKVRKTGNEYFSKNLHWDALKFYTESIALAPKGTEEQAFAYGNRAACLLKLNFPKEALEDVETALKLPARNDFKNKLLTRKEKCLSMVNNCNKSNCMLGCDDLVPLSNRKSSCFDSASNLIGLLYDEYFERQLVAQSNIKTGDVLIVEKPYSSVLLADHFYTHCMNCFIRSVKLIPCDRCTIAMFCSEECRTNSIRYHATECSILDALVQLKAERMELLSLRILIDASSQGEYLEKLHSQTLEYSLSKRNNNENSQTYKSLDYLNIYNLVTNTAKRTADDLLYRSAISMVVIFLLENYTRFFERCTENKKHSLKMFSGGLILHFMQSLPCNAHEISEFCEDGLKEIGAGAYATLSLINHSCDPNVVRYSYKDSIVLRAIKPIQKGEQILDNYGYHYAIHSLDERQTALMKQYYFKCKCEPCAQFWTTYEDLPEQELYFKKYINVKVYQQLTDKFEKNLNSILNGTFDANLIEENMRYLDFLDEFVQRPWKNYNKCQEAIKHCLSFYGNHFRFSKEVAS